MPTRIASYREFWRFYLGQHRRRATRALHLFGTLLGICLLVAALILAEWRLAVASALAGYAFAWLSHIWIEKNRPATFKYPIWSLHSDFRMLGLWLMGRLHVHLQRHGTAPPD